MLSDNILVTVVKILHQVSVTDINACCALITEECRALNQYSALKINNLIIYLRIILPEAFFLFLNIPQTLTYKLTLLP